MATTTDDTQSQATPGTMGLWNDGAKSGKQQEWIIMAPIKEGQAATLRKTLENAQAQPQEDVLQLLMDIGNLHESRAAMFDNDTRFLFATTFNGDWDTYISEWQMDPRIPPHVDALLGPCEGWPGFMHPDVRTWFAEHGVSSQSFRTAYPDLTVQDIWKQQRVNNAFQAVLDTPEFRAALENPANAALVATPAFQALLNEAAN